MTEELERILRMFGLRKYETDVYVRLMKSGPLSAGEVAELAGVPNPRVYTILNALKKMGYIYEIKGRPSLYDAQHPRHILQTESARLRKRMDSILEKAEQDYEMRKDQRLISTCDAWTMYGEKGRVAELLRLINAARKDMMIVARDLDWSLEEDIIRMLKSKRNDRVLIRVIGTNADLIRETADIFRVASGGEVRLVNSNDPPTLFAVADQHEVLIMLKKSALTDRDDYTSVTIRNNGVAALYRKYFEDLWREAKMEEYV